MTLNHLTLSLQFARFDGVQEHRAALPRHAAARFIRHALSSDAEITVRIVDAEEGQALNREYRHKDYATNVLTFDYAQEPLVMADLVLCAPVVAREAREQNREPARALRPPAGARHAARPGLGPRDQRRGRRRDGGLRNGHPAGTGLRRPVRGLSRPPRRPRPPRHRRGSGSASKQPHAGVSIASIAIISIANRPPAPCAAESSPARRSPSAPACRPQSGRSPPPGAAPAPAPRTGRTAAAPRPAPPPG